MTNTLRCSEPLRCLGLPVRAAGLPQTNTAGLSAPNTACAAPLSHGLPRTFLHRHLHWGWRARRLSALHRHLLSWTLLTGHRKSAPQPWSSSPSPRADGTRWPIPVLTGDRSGGGRRGVFLEPDQNRGMSLPLEAMPALGAGQHGGEGVLELIRGQNLTHPGDATVRADPASVPSSMEWAHQSAWAQQLTHGAQRASPPCWLASRWEGAAFAEEPGSAWLLGHWVGRPTLEPPCARRLSLQANQSSSLSKTALIAFINTCNKKSPDSSRRPTR